MWEEGAPRAEVKRADRLQGRKVVVLLEDAVLELAKGNQGSLQLLEGLQHRRLLQKEDRDSTDVRPDIVHHCLLALQESPLNKAGRLCVFIRTRDRQLIEVHPQLRVPATYEEFRKLMVNLLHTRRIRAVEKNVTLLQVTKNDPNLFLPVGSRKIGLWSTLWMLKLAEEIPENVERSWPAFSSKGRPVNLEEFVQQFQHTENPVLFLLLSSVLGTVLSRRLRTRRRMRFNRSMWIKCSGVLQQPLCGVRELVEYLLKTSFASSFLTCE